MEDKEQKLRYSRQLATYGREMQERIMDLKFFIYGSRGLGAEIAKHLVMNGVKQVHICDPYPAELRDLSANYFMDQSLIGQKSQDESKESLEQSSRAEATIKGIKALNRHVECKVIDQFDIQQIIEHKYDGVIITESYGLDWSSDTDLCLNIYKINYELRNNDIGFILAEACGMYGYLFNDFGDNFSIINTGIEEEKTKIKDITFENECVVTFKYELENALKVNDIVEFLNLEGSTGIKLLNEKEYHIVEIIDQNNIRIDCDTSNFSYTMDGATISFKKRGETKHYFSLSESIKNMTSSVMDQKSSLVQMLFI